MKLEVLLSLMNLNKKDLSKMNITSDTIVINQCKKEGYEEYKNFKIYSYDEVGAANSRNRALDNSSADILLFGDDDVIYEDNFEEIIIKEFSNNPKADVLVFNIHSPNRLAKENKKNKRIHFYNYMRYTTTRIAVRRKSIIDNNIRFNTLFGPGSKYSHGDDTIFLKDCLKKGLKIYANTNYLGTVYQNNSTWFKGYNKKFFYDKGVIFTELSRTFKYFLFIQFLIRHKESLNKISFINAFKCMCEGSNDYLASIKDR